MDAPAPKRKLFTRRRFLQVGLIAAGTVAAVVTEAKCIEPDWVKIRRVRIGQGPFKHRFVHFTDLHHKGDTIYLQSVVAKINVLTPDFICFTGDIVEEDRHLPEALEILAGVKAPMFGIPGNHDYWSKASFVPIKNCFAVTGGAWLVDEAQTIASGAINLIGADCTHVENVEKLLRPDMTNLLLIHYPAWIKKLSHLKFDLTLAGHSHGGQVRIPFYGALSVPYAVDEYDLGLFQTTAGPLYVNPGIGYVYDYRVRFNCRPEITVIEI